jgi:hypothetical protein
MHTEHLQNVSVGRVLLGWAVAAAITSFVLLMLAAFHALPFGGDGGWWNVVAAGVGFFGGGFFAGFRAMQAPILHGVAIALMTLVVWVIVNVAVFGVSGQENWAGLNATLTAVIMLVMIVASVVGALLGYNLAVVGKPGLSEHEPL